MRIIFMNVFSSGCRTILLGSWMALLLLSVVAQAQERTVTGKVTATDDSALPGVNVIVKGTTIGTVTDIEGNYRLNVPQDAEVLVYSFIGYAQKEVPINNQTTLNVQLAEDVTQLSEVVVTAFEVQRNKNELPYAVQSIGGEEVSKTRNPNFMNSLSGKVAGLNVRQSNSLGGSTNIILRGYTSLKGNNQPLFVVDGVPIDNSITNTEGVDDPDRNQQEGRGGFDYGNAAADVNPDDIASISVLKGSAATALYGSRAANGVIIITTKQGRKEGIGVTVNSGVTLGFVDKSTFAEYQHLYGGGYGAYYESDDGFFLSRDIDGDGQDDLVVPTSEDASHGGAFDPNLMVYQWDAFDPSSPNYHKARPWVAAEHDPSDFFDNSVLVNNSIFIDGGDEQGYFKLGYTRSDQKGILPNSEVDKDLVNFSASYDLVENLTASASVNFSKIDGLGRYGTGYDSRNLMTNFRQWWQTDVDVEEQRAAYERTGKNVTWNWTDPTDLTPIYWDNPYWTRYENYESDNRARYYGFVKLNYKVTDWFDLLGMVSLDSYDELQEERIAVGSVDVSKYSRFNRAFREYNYQLLANFNKDLGDDFNLKGLLGGNIRKTSIESIYAETNGGLLIPGLYALLNTANPLEAPVEKYSLEQVNGLFANVTLGYRDFLFLDISGRRDESSTLPKGNNVYYYPSISGGFVFTRLIGGGLDWLNYGKARINYAEVGNTAPPLYVQDYYDVPTGINGVPLSSVDNTKNNLNLKPERTKSFEVGLEMGFFSSHLGFDATYYQQNTVDQIVPLPISRATGYDYKVINAGEIKNEGFEVTAFAIPVETSEFSWRVNVNWSRNRNEVVALAETDNLQLADFQGGVSINAALGEPYGTIRGSNFKLNDQGERIVGSNGFYLQSATSNEIIGNANPDWIGGINNSFTYKNISFGFLIDVRKGGDIFTLDQHYGLATGIYPETAGLNDLGNPVRDPVDDGGGVILPGVKEDGSPNDIRVSAVNYGTFGYRRNPNAAFVYDASFVKLREASFTYSFPETLIEKTPFTGIDLSLIGNNLWIMHKNLPHGDPEENISAGNIQGYQGGAYPTTRNIGFNVRLSF